MCKKKKRKLFEEYQLVNICNIELHYKLEDIFDNSLIVNLISSHSSFRFVYGTKIESWTDSCGNIALATGCIKYARHSLIFNGNSFLKVKLKTLMHAPITIILVGHAESDNTLFDAINASFELCHGFPLQDTLRIGRVKWVFVIEWVFVRPNLRFCP